MTADLNKLCRLCSAHRTNGISLLDPSHQEYSLEVSATFKLEINSENGFPTALCSPCLSKLQQILSLKISSIHAHTYFCSLLKVPEQCGKILKSDVGLQTEELRNDNPPSQISSATVSDDMNLSEISMENNCNVGSGTVDNGISNCVTGEKNNVDEEIIDIAEENNITYHLKDIRIVIDKNEVRNCLKLQKPLQLTLQQQDLILPTKQEVADESHAEETNEIHRSDEISTAVPEPQVISTEIRQSEISPVIHHAVPEPQVSTETHRSEVSTEIHRSEGSTIPLRPAVPALVIPALHELKNSTEIHQSEISPLIHHAVSESSTKIHRSKVSTVPLRPEVSSPELEILTEIRSSKISTVIFHTSGVSSPDVPKLEVSTEIHEPQQVESPEEEEPTVPDFVDQQGSEKMEYMNNLGKLFSASTFNLLNDESTNNVDDEIKSEIKIEEMVLEPETNENVEMTSRHTGHQLTPYNLTKDVIGVTHDGDNSNEVATEEVQDHFSEDTHAASAAKTDPNLFVCHLCSKDCKTTRQLKIHLSRIHTLNKNQIDKHVPPTFCLSCKYCPRQFNIPSHLRMHEDSHTRPYSCDICDKKFSRVHNLKSHTFKMHSESFNCSLCNYKCKSNRSLINHGKAQHSVAGVLKKFKCYECDKSFKNTHKLKKHMKSLNHKAPWKCEKCDKSYVIKSSLTHHKKFYHNEFKYYSCSHCDWKCTLFYNLKVHIETQHAGHFYFKCDHCEKMFYLKNQLKRHIQSFHLACFE